LTREGLELSGLTKDSLELIRFHVDNQASQRDQDAVGQFDYVMEELGLGGVFLLTWRVPLLGGATKSSRFLLVWLAEARDQFVSGFRSVVLFGGLKTGPDWGPSGGTGYTREFFFFLDMSYGVQDWMGRCLLLD